MSLASVRSELAAAAGGVAGLTVRARPTVKAPRTGDGWVAVQRIVPASFRSSAVTFAVVVCLGADLAKAEELFEEWAIPLLDVVTQTVPAADVAVEPVTLTAEQGAVLHAFTLILTVEV